MTVGAAALVTDHIWLVDQRDVLKTAASAASIAATLELNSNPSIKKPALEAVAERYLLVNLTHLPPERLTRAKDTLEVTVNDINRATRTVTVRAEADLGGTLLSRNLPLLDNYEGPESIVVKAGVDSSQSPAEVVLAIDISSSMSWDLAGDNKPPAGSQNARIEIVKKAASNLVDIIGPDAHNRVAVGIVPWHNQVRLASATANHWVRKDWAVHPEKRRYEVPYLNCQRFRPATCTNLPAGIEETLPGPDHNAWAQCLDEHRVGTGSTAAQPGTIADRLAPPSQNPFAQSWFPAGYGVSYQCLDPQSSGFPADLKSQSCYELPSGADRVQLRAQHGVDLLSWFTPHQRAQHYFCPSQTATILPLSTEPDEIKQAIRALVPAGRLTYSALGVLWGQRLLTPSWKGAWRGSGAHPLDPSAGEDEVRKAIVLLTDGEDTYCGNRNHGCDDSPVGISRADACQAVKDAGTEIFVVAAMNPQSISSALGQALRECSSAADNPDGTYVFLNNATAESLEAAFADIASQLRTLRKVF